MHKPLMKRSIKVRVAALEHDRPTNAEIINYITRPGNLPDTALAARIVRYTPAHIRRMTNEELIAFIQSEEVKHNEIN